MNKCAFVKVGDFFFKWRNLIFPFFVAGLCLAFPPVSGNSGISLYVMIAGITLVIFGLTFRLATIGWAYIKRGGLNKKVYADTLVTDGFFGLCRNPLYVGNMLIYSGVFIFHGHPVVIIFGILSFYLIYEAIMAAEEHFLNNKFADIYESYCKNVNRWLPDFSKYKSSTSRMSFSLKRCIIKDYTTIYNSLIILILINLLRVFRNGNSEELYNQACAAGSFILGLSIVVILIKLWKGKTSK